MNFQATPPINDVQPPPHSHGQQREARFPRDLSRVTPDLICTAMRCRVDSGVDSGQDTRPCLGRRRQGARRTSWVDSLRGSPAVESTDGSPASPVAAVAQSSCVFQFWPLAMKRKGLYRLSCRSPRVYVSVCVCARVRVCMLSHV